MACSDTIVPSGGAEGTRERLPAAQELDNGAMERHRVGVGSPSPQSSTSTTSQLTPAPCAPENPEKVKLSGENLAMDADAEYFPPPSSSVDVQPSISGTIEPLGPSAAPKANGYPSTETGTVCSSSSMYLGLDVHLEGQPALDVDALVLLQDLERLEGGGNGPLLFPYPSLIAETVEELLKI